MTSSTGRAVLKHLGRGESWRKVLADKLTDLGNFIFGALVIGQVLSDNGYDWVLAGLGLAALVILYARARSLL